MNLQLLQGQFSPHEAIDIITKMVHVKIKFHEDKIHSLSDEEDIKIRKANTATAKRIIRSKKFYH